MSATFGGTIKLEGESEYRKALSTINQQIKTTASELSLLAVQYDKNEESVEGYTARNKTLEKEIEQQEKKVALLRGAMEQAAETYGETDKRTQRYQESLNKAQAVLIKMQREIEDNKKAINEFGSEAVDSSKKVEKLEISVDDAGDSFEGLKKSGAIAVAGITAVVGVAAAAVTKFLSLADSTKEIRTQTAQLEASFSKFGEDIGYEQATDTLYELQGVLGDIGRSTEASTLIAKVSKDEKDLEANTRILTGVFAKYGESIPTEGLAEGIAATAEMGSVQGVLADALEWQGINLDDYNAKLESMSTAEERASYTQKTLTKLYGESADAYRENNKALIEANEAQLRQEQILGDLGAMAEPIITEFKNKTSGLLIEMHGPLQILSDGLMSALTGGEDAGGKLEQGLSELISILLENVNEVAPQVLGVAVDIIPGLVSTILDEAPILLQTIIDIGVSVIDILGQPDVLPSILQEIAALIPEIVILLLDNTPLLLETAITLFMSLVESLPIILEELTVELPEIIEKLIPVLISMSPILFAASVELFMALIEAIPSVALSLVEKMPLIIDSIVSGLGDGFEKVKEIGKELLAGLWEGIQEKWMWLKERLAEFADTFMGNVREVFDINSPSRLMRDSVGVYLAEGVGVGFIEGMDKVNAEIKNALPTDYSVGINATVNGNIQTSYQMTTIDMFKAALAEYKPMVILDDREVGHFIISTVSQEVFA